jgi:hypothetical protein
MLGCAPSQPFLSGPSWYSCFIVGTPVHFTEIQDIESSLQRKPTNTEHSEATKYLQKIGDRYVYNGTSGLYEPKPSNSKGDNEHHPSQETKRPLFHVEVKRDWLILVLSFLTLLGLGFTVRYTRKQWLESNRSAGTSENTLGEIQKQTKLSLDIARGTSAAYVTLSFNPPPNEEPNSPGLVFISQGPLHAQNFSGSVELQCEDLLSRKIISSTRASFGGTGVIVSKEAAFIFTPITPKGCETRLVFNQSIRGLIRNVHFTYMNGLGELALGGRCDEYVEFKYPADASNPDAVYRVIQGWRPCADIPALYKGAWIPFDTTKEYRSATYRKQHPETQ